MLEKVGKALLTSVQEVLEANSGQDPANIWQYHGGSTINSREA